VSYLLQPTAEKAPVTHESRYIIEANIERFETRLKGGLMSEQQVGVATKLLEDASGEAPKRGDERQLYLSTSAHLEFLGRCNPTSRTTPFRKRPYPFTNARRVAFPVPILRAIPRASSRATWSG
jgi:predicted component of type VI protein secretion system